MTLAPEHQMSPEEQAEMPQMSPEEQAEMPRIAPGWRPPAGTFEAAQEDRDLLQQGLTEDGEEEFYAVGLAAGAAGVALVGWMIWLGLPPQVWSRKVPRFLGDCSRHVSADPDVAVWPLFDKVVAQCLDECRTGPEVEVPEQHPPAPTPLLETAVEGVRIAVDDTGCMNTMLHLNRGSDQLNVSVLAVDGSQCFLAAAAVIVSEDVEEMVVLMDMVACGQDVEFDDFLAGVWYVGGEFYSLIVDYKKHAVESERVVRAPRFDNRHWNRMIRKAYFPVMERAREIAAARRML